MSYSDLRAKARKSLGGNIFAENWLMMVLVVVLVGIAAGIVATVTFGIGGLIIIGPVMFAVYGLYLRMIRGGKIQLERLIDGFKVNVARNILLGLLQGIFIFLWSLLFIIPGIIKAYSYSMSFFIANDNPDWTWKQCLDESKKIMKGKKFKLFVLQLTFIGWLIVGALAFGIGALWVEAYMQAAQAAFYDEINPVAANVGSDNYTSDNYGTEAL